MRFIVTCGGSGGHINPGLAVASVLRDGGHEVLFVGATQGLERDLVPREGFRIEFVEARSLIHSLTPKALAHNAGTVWRTFRSGGAAKRIVRRFAPAAVLGTGGYASFPALRAAQKLGIPTLIHESNAFPGVTTKLIAKRADAVLVAIERSRSAYPNPEKVKVVGTPVRPEFFTLRREAARRSLGLDGRPVVVSLLGSQGAREVNKLILELMAMNGGAYRHIHAAGPKRVEALLDEARKRGLSLTEQSGLTIKGYIHNMAEVLAAADLVVCRGGASTLAELSAAGKAAIVIPSPNVAADHQTANARMLGGAAAVLPESGLTADELRRTVNDLLENPLRRARMEEGMKRLAVPDSAAAIAGLMVEFGKS
ncbi:MAG: UDP-N-acetylglucosamine--N-acetylmuramyl-(pentapeptide) pyrophosphoryl-undecaprenol N-acetylglucosamine transferase [Oscillospiraceae bacterium]|jgi:UDP-N-acetylglucosamine--N-acetylmuramyl-(pentapeptide) pyrophosphoryl-undecaprenol N-acetylglucosamine transferase|nr:UDP-N-acetylglucosamine--N-acetylmuramyl-(pentapeptide) pyrophosphoryl-undecaprenol N-acetylglucosamine transferase [Oscillospiraceae bacterium]